MIDQAIHAGYSSLMKNGFTLVELSIVLVIIGLLIGGILVGESLVSSARITAQVSQFQQFDAAGTSFKTTYKNLPGDSKYGAYPGNHNKVLGINSGETCLTTYLAGETTNFFPSLSAVGYLKGRYLPTWPTSGFAVLNYGFGEGYQYPYSKLDPKKAIATIGIANGDVFYFLPLSNQFKPSGGAVYMSALVNPADSMKAADALAIDQKMDDGYPDTGGVVAAGNNNALPAHNSGAGCTLPYALADSNTVYPAPSYAATPSCVSSGTPRRYNMNASNICQISVRASLY